VRDLQIYHQVIHLLFYLFDSLHCCSKVAIS